MMTWPARGHVLLRWSMALVFLLFGISQVYVPTDWTGFVPEFVSRLVSPGILVILNGSLEIIFGLLLLSGLYMRLSALVLGLHLAGIAFSMGYSPLAIRDMGLALATLSLALFEPDPLSLDGKRIRKESAESL